MTTNAAGASPVDLSLGPLPEPLCNLPSHWVDPVQDYAAALVAAERERCAKLCDEVSREHFSEGMTWESNGAAACAARLRRA